ncbi:hypothetical protein [Halorarius litoreus]|uniref:hypothetical protein n=1 Tax=Halorarius litoreus TaxID=2962676 RepID=UPI0020CDDD0B|nr:hypothetical protein [Halorarius litoreus]
MRTAALLATALVLLAGCTAGPVGTSESPTKSPTPTVSPTTTCTDHQRETVDPVRDEVAPSDLPDRPGTLNQSTVRAYVVAYEEAYARNGRLSRISTRVTTNVGDVRVTETADGWRVRLNSQTNTWAAGTETADGTPTVIHGDGPRVPVTYWLTDGRLVRATADYDETPTRQSGRVVQCF